MRRHTARLAAPLALIAFGHLACSAAPTGADDADQPTDTGSDGGGGGVEDTGSPPLDGDWGVGGTLRLVGGAPSLEGSALVLQTRAVTCDVPATITAAAPLDPLPEGAKVAWTLTVAPSPDATCAWLGPTTLRLGLGDLDPTLRPAADRLGAPWDGSYGLVLGGPRGTAWLVGVAHPDADDTDGAHTDVADTLVVDTADTGHSDVPGPPVPPDAEYALVTLHGIPLSP